MRVFLLIINISCSVFANSATANSPATSTNLGSLVSVAPDDAGGAGGEEIVAQCDILSDDGGWTTIQRRVESDKENFNRTWDEYEEGFGRLDESFWLGLNLISELTKAGDMELYIKLMDWDNNVAIARYATFKVGSQRELYKLSVANYSGNAGDSLSRHNGMAFTTKDRDNDEDSDSNCAQTYSGAWWHHKCHNSNLNGLDLIGSHESFANGINWQAWKGYNYSLKRTEMKIRSKRFRCLRASIKRQC